MKRVIAASLLVLLCWSLASAKTVFMKSEEAIEAIDAWRVNDTVYVKVNRDTVLEFPSSEVDLTRSRIQAAKNAKSNGTAHRKTSYEKPSGKTPRDLVSQVMELSGLDREVSRFPHYMMQSVENSNARNRSDSGSQVVNAIVENFDLDEAQGLVRKYLATHGDRSTLEDARRWLSGTVGRKMMEADLEAERSGRDEVITYMGGIKSDPGFHKRMDLFRQIDKEGRLTEALARAESLTISGLVDALPLAAQEKAAIKKEEASTIEKSKSELRRHTVAKLAYEYRTLTDEELLQYLHFLRSKNGRKFSLLTMEAYEKMLQQIFANVKKANAFRDANSI